MPTLAFMEDGWVNAIVGGSALDNGVGFKTTLHTV